MFCEYGHRTLGQLFYYFNSFKEFLYLFCSVVLRQGWQFGYIFKDCFQCRTIQITTFNSFELQLLVLDSDTPLVVTVVYRPPKPHKDIHIC